MKEQNQHLAKMGITATIAVAGYLTTRFVDRKAEAKRKTREAEEERNHEKAMEYLTELNDDFDRRITNGKFWLQVIPPKE